MCIATSKKSDVVGTYAPVVDCDLVFIYSSKAGRGGVRGGDQEMSLSEFKAGVAYLAWLLCKGKTLADRVDMFMSVHYKSV